MKNIKLKSLLKEDEMKAKSMWNRLDADSREDILLRFVKNPADAEKMVMKTWDTLPDNIAGNKDFQDAITDQKGLRETNIKMVDQGYAQDFYKIKSDIISTWTDTNTIEADIKGYLELAHESGGPKLVREVMNAILAGVNNAKPLLRQLKGTSPADVDLAETKSTKLSSLVKEVMAYGEEEAIKMIWDDPGGKIESKLKGINGYESIALGGPSASGKTYPPAGISIYFTNKKAAIIGAAVLSNLVPGPEYEKMIKVGNGYAAIELEA